LKRERRSARVAHFDAMTGASGDMILAALVDAGAPVEELRRRLSSLPVPGFVLEAGQSRSRGLRGTRVRVEVPDEETERRLPEIEAILKAGSLPPGVVADSLRVFQRLAEAEAACHGIAPEEVHFHEVGALDAIVDVAGSVLALALLEVEKITFSALRVGSGEVETAHGVLPVPVPAVLELTKGAPIVRTSIAGEILTPTGAAILTTLGRPAEDFTLVAEAVGVGCGTRELPDRPNVLRVTIGTLPAPHAGSDLHRQEDEVVVLETNVDDMSPEMIPAALERALAAGALDAFVTPVLMKKGRPGHLLTVLAPPGKLEQVAEVLFRETTTFGVRMRRQSRWTLARESREIASRWGPVLVKIGDLGGGYRRVTPEYESCREIADRTGTPLGEVYREIERLIRSSEWISPAEREP
jgi:uncharacterized protein (TIGR00299 family) protein